MSGVARVGELADTVSSITEPQEGLGRRTPSFTGVTDIVLTLDDFLGRLPAAIVA